MPPKKDKILFISQYAGFIGGLEKYIHSLSLLLRKNGFRTYSLYVEKTRFSEEFLSGFDGSRNISEIGEISQADFDFVTLHKISRADVMEKILARFSPAVFVHDHDYFCPKGYKYFPYKRVNCARAHNAFVCGVCASMVPPRHISDGFANMLRKNFIDSARLCALVKKCPKFVVLSDFMARELIANGIPPEKISILHPWEIPDKSPIKPSSAGAKKIVFAAQQVMSKGTPLALEAIKKTVSDVTLEILGAGKRLEDFKKMSEDMGLSKKVEFCGWVENPTDYFRKADIALFPSLWQEPFGLSGIEAMNAGVPVVGFDVGGVSEWLKDGLNGLLVDERDTDAMAKAIDKLATNEPLRLSLAQNAKKFVEENYSPETFLKNFSSLL